MIDLDCVTVEHTVSEQVYEKPSALFKIVVKFSEMQAVLENLAKGISPCIGVMCHRIYFAPTYLPNHG